MLKVCLQALMVGIDFDLTGAECYNPNNLRAAPESPQVDQ